MDSIFAPLFYGGEGGEFSSATTTQLYHVHQKQWDLDLIRRLGLPDHIFPSVRSTRNVGGFHSA